MNRGERFQQRAKERTEARRLAEDVLGFACKLADQLPPHSRKFFWHTINKATPSIKVPNNEPNR